MPRAEPEGRRGRPSPSGVDAGGVPVVVACSVGVDLDLVPAAADARLAARPRTPGWCWCVPERDDHPVTRRAGRLPWPDPAEVVTRADGDWRQASVRRGVAS